MNENIQFYSNPIIVRGISFMVSLRQDSGLKIIPTANSQQNSNNWRIMAWIQLRILDSPGAGKLYRGSVGRCLFGATELGFGNAPLMKWDKLMLPENRYIRGGKCVLEISLQAGVLQESVCDRMFKFVHVRDEPHSRNGLLTVTCGLLSSAAYLNVSSRKTFELLPNLVFGKLLATNWNYLRDPSNEFLSKDAFFLDVEVDVSSPDDAEDGRDAANAENARNAENAEPIIRVECPVCLDSLIDKHVLSTDCGHMCCDQCIRSPSR